VSFSLAVEAGGLELGVDIPIATPSSSSLGSPCCIPMLLVLKPSLPVLTMRIAATAPWLFFISHASFPFSTLIFTGASFSACKCPSIPSSTDSPKWTATGDSLKVRHHLYVHPLVSRPQPMMLHALENVDGWVSQDQGHQVAWLRLGVELQMNQPEARYCKYPPKQWTQALHPLCSSAEPQTGREVSIFCTKQITQGPPNHQLNKCAQVEDDCEVLEA